MTSEQQELDRSSAKERARANLHVWASPVISVLALVASVVALLVSTAQSSKISGTATCLTYITLARQIAHDHPDDAPADRSKAVRAVLRQTGGGTGDQLDIETECGTVDDVIK